MKHLMTRGVAALGLVCLTAGALQAAGRPVIIPAPRQLEMREGLCPAGTIRYEQKTDLPAEGYELSIAPTGIVVRHADEAGAYYARRTLLHIATVKDEKGRASYPCLEIRDWPQFKWRGVHLDDARHFFGKEVVKRTLEQMSWYKLNVLHWHLTEDQSWTIDVPGCPELVQWGARRKTMPAHGAKRDEVRTGEPYGPYFYTRADIEEILAYAAERHITVVPEIEIPGHVFALLCAHPEFACSPENVLRRNRELRVWCAGVEQDVLCVGNPEAIRFVEKVLDYVCSVFPSEVIHIGGDECPRTAWKSCPKCQAMMKREGMKDEAELQMWVSRHFADYLAKKGRRTIGWYEIFGGGGLPKSAIGMRWRKGDAPGAAVNEGYQMVMCPTSHCYFDYAQGLAEDPYQYIAGDRRYIKLSRVYEFDPLAGIAPEARKNVLGGQCANWSSHTWNRYDLEWKLWPRALALAEVLWTYPEQRDFAEFAKRAAEHRRRLIRAKINCAPLK